MGCIWKIFSVCLAFMGIASIGSLAFAISAFFMNVAIEQIDYILGYIERWKR